jgi:nucleoside-triphosphatase
MPPTLLLTGRPGVGKTTVLVKVAQLLVGRSVAGFYTREIRDATGRRRGFKGVSFAGGEDRVIAATDLPGGPRVSRYGVDLEALDRLVEEALAGVGEAEVVLLDEIGKMECLSHRFVRAVEGLLAGDGPLVATVAASGGGFVADVKARSDVEVREITRDNRDEQPGRIHAWVEQALSG